MRASGPHSDVGVLMEQRDHGLCFPGGLCMHAADNTTPEGPVAAGIREAHEELGIGINKGGTYAACAYTCGF